MRDSAGPSPLRQAVFPLRNGGASAGAKQAQWESDHVPLIIHARKFQNPLDELDRPAS
jgi:hypothetical protein